ncbi:MAG: polyprenol phosphomannose-dependent alpha 1,6 mannosyltransferase MptB [Mycobacteriaceae bacterium]|nr:polyprenol phosphomannose-dependent alpha 1,6 mannosyltransferase MptB [Mycobacteriaceae bacterium]
MLGFGRRALGLDVPDPPHTVAILHDHDEPDVPELSPSELVQLQRIRRFGAVGAVLMAIGALGAGAQPVLQNPTYGQPVLGLFSRTLTSSLAICWVGIVMVVLAWLLLGRFALGDLHHGAPRRLTRSQLDRTLLLWVLPLTVAPPMFSRDVYSYLAQSEIALRGLDPYVLGPAPALGVGDVLTSTVPNIWRETPAPYGPLFLWLGKGIAAMTGDNILAGIFLHRLLALAGVSLIVWALPRLARSCGVSEVTALWLGAANPLVLFHLVSGVHNEALMLGLMLAGVVLAMEAVDSPLPLRGHQFVLLVGGCTLIAVSAMVKIPTLAALGFVGMALARRWAGGEGAAWPGAPAARRWRALLLSGAMMSAIAVVVTLGVTFVSGLGFGWVNTLGTANAVRSWMSLPTAFGVITGFAGVLLGLGDHTTAVLNLTRPIAAAAAAFVVLRMLVATYTGRLPVVGALGVAFGAIVLFFPVVQPWYLLWAVLPLAAWATRPAFRVPTIAFSSVVCIILMPTGKDEVPFVIVQAALAATITVALLIFATRRVLPWRAHRAVPAR